MSIRFNPDANGIEGASLLEAPSKLTAAQEFTALHGIRRPGVENLALRAFRIDSQPSRQTYFRTRLKQFDRIVGEKVRREKALDFSGCNSRPGTGRSIR